MSTSASTDARCLSAIAQRARSRYVKRIAGDESSVAWWTDVIITSSSSRQAERYSEEIRHRREQGKVPAGVTFLVAPDVDDERIGSGGATINALRLLAAQLGAPEGGDELEDWWTKRRVFVVHSGGDSRRLPQYSLSGKLFSALPVKTPWGETSTVFDEFLALSTDWAEKMPSGLLVASGDVILTFDAQGLRWDRAGVCGVGIRQPVEVGSRHGVYVADDEGRVYSFLQKPSAAQVRAAGGLLENGQVALDTGLLRFDPTVSARLTELGTTGGLFTRTKDGLPVLDLYEHMTMALTGQWRPGPRALPALRQLSDILRGVPFWCSVVDGDFTHVGTTTAFRRLITEDTNFSRLYAVQQRLGAVTSAGMNSAGVMIDSVFSGGGELGSGAVAIECDLDVPVRAGRGAILHGITGLKSLVEVPPDVVVHQVPVRTPDGRRGVVVRVYGVDDDPKGSVEARTATWFGRPILEALASLDLHPEQVWAGIPVGSRTLWNAALFVFGTLEEAWSCARWLMGLEESFHLEQWKQAERLSLAQSAQWADTQALADARARRGEASWRLTALSLADTGTDLRPLLAHPPGITPLASAGRSLRSRARLLESEGPTEAASRYYQASLFLGHAGLEDEAAEAEAAAFACVQSGVDRGVYENEFSGAAREWRHDAVTVSAPPRIDMGGGWSDTPPFCLDWGGTVLNMAVELNGEYPIRTEIRRLEEPVVRCVSEGENETAEFRSTAEILAPPSPGSPFSIPRVALRMTGIVREDEPLARTLARYGGGLEIRTVADLPMGSGLGTSSILAATLLRALAEMLGCRLTEQALSDQVMRLEQKMTTGGGWQDQIGGIFPGAKLAISGPGLRQRVRVEPVGWSEIRQQEFAEHFVLYYTGIRRMAKDLLRQVVGSYLAREVATVQVLHSIKTLALEMAYALREGEWDYLGRLIDRHWELNQVLDPHTTNAPINVLLREIRPYLAGAKLAGAGGGGFLMLLAKGRKEAAALRERLAQPTEAMPGALYEYRIAADGLRVRHDAEPVGKKGSV